LEREQGGHNIVVIEWQVETFQAKRCVCGRSGSCLSEGQTISRATNKGLSNKGGEIDNGRNNN